MVISDNFEKLRVLAPRSDDSSMNDMSIYHGSGGVLFGLYWYIYLLKKETSQPNCPYSAGALLGVAEKLIDQALKENFEFVIKNLKGGADTCATFL